jgi:threonine/homoserine/homoserine lactone efflux protein
VTIATALWSFALVAALLTIIPGLDTALVLRSSLTQTRRHAYATAFGICAGAFVWGAAAAIGAAALLAASEIAFAILKLAGAGYMVYLGVTMIIASFRARDEVGTQALPIAPRGYAAAFGKGFLTNLLNPKVGVFYIALIPQFIPEGALPLGMGLLLALVHIVESLLWFSAIIFAAQFARRWLVSRRVTRWVDRLTGGILIGFAALLAFESKPAS